MPPFILSAFGDEIAGDLHTQLTTLTDLGVKGLDLRGAWGKNVRDFSADDARRARQLCDDHGVTVRCIGSPIGKAPLAAPAATALADLDHILATAHIVGTHHIRVFSFYPEDANIPGSSAHYDQYLPAAADRLAALAEKAGAAGCTLLHENEKGIVGDTPERNAALVNAVNSPHLRLIWDPANYVQVGVADQVTRYWALLAPLVAYIHIKDARLDGGGVTPAGEGDGQVPDLLRRLHASGYDGVLSLEPHLKVAGHSGGHSGPDGMAVAVKALRDLLAGLDSEAA